MEIEEIIAQKREIECELLSHEGVTGVDVGYKYKSGKRTKQVVIRVYVAKKQTKISKSDKIPKTIRRRNHWSPETRGWPGGEVENPVAESAKLFMNGVSNRPGNCSSNGYLTEKTIRCVGYAPKRKFPGIAT